MISSYIPGRARIRHSSFKDQAVLGMVLGMLENYSGVREVSANPRTGSILVSYDPQAISDQELETALSFMESNLGADVPKKSPLCFDDAAALNITLVLTLLGLIFPGARKVHTVAGGLFTLLALNHSWQRCR